MMNPIKSVKVLKSQIEHGGEVKPCLAVVIEPYPDTEHELERVGDALRACMLGLKSEEVE
ncbi:MAG: hypothetical protein KAS66_05590 [Candidatus Omnitrophica bacterium]|nr:hypothetical protein [Candidatus Omnitrophota bacterium]